MFHAIIEADALETTLDNADAIVDEFKMKLSEDGILIEAVDPANVSMISDTLQKSAFESYEATEGVLGINLNRMQDIVGMASSGGLVEMELDEETRKLHIKVDGLEYTLALIDPASIREEPEIPDLGLDGKVVLDSSHLSQGIKAGDMVTDHLEFTITEVDGVSALQIHGEGDTDDAMLTLKEGEKLEEIEPADVLSLFSIDYLKDMKKSIPKSTDVTLKIGEEMPMKISYDYADGAGNTVFMLAPRIQSE